MPNSPTPIHLLIVDDHPVVRHGLRSLLAEHADIEIVGEAANAAELFPLLTHTSVDLILLDIRLEGQSGIEIARRVRHTYPDLKIIILTTYDDESYLHQAMEIGVHGFLLKSASHETLPDSIQAVMQGEKLLSPALVTRVIGDYQRLLQEESLREAGLAAEDVQILAAIATGEGNREIAARFFVSEATIKRRIQEIIEKMGASNRSQAIAEAVRKGWI
jgi:DNA-binding NarL/FixJ family response regulator